MTDDKTLKLKSDLQHNDIQSQLSKKKRPVKILRAMMNALETYRQSKKYGWSRPWNKYDLMNFQSFKLNWERDEDKQMLSCVEPILNNQFPDMPDDALCFCRELIEDQSGLMGFVFVHEYSEGEKKYEGATLSLGRISEKRYRDRLDIILESPVVAGRSSGLGRVRIYVDPFQSDITDPLWCDTQAVINPEVLAPLFERLSSLSWESANDSERLWDHWTSNYIDYFGDRNWAIDNSYFFVKGNPQARLSPKPTITEQRNVSALG